MSSEYHYKVIERAIAIIDQNQSGEIQLSDLAQQLNMSPSHFQRIFSQWAGVSPKRYQQYLKLDQARKMLGNNSTVMETAHKLGYSGGSRLHDLFLRWEAMTPGEYARAGFGLDIYYGSFSSPFGTMLVLGTDKGLCGIAFTAQCGQINAYKNMCNRWPKATFSEQPKRLEKWVQAVLDQSGETKMFLAGGPFQIKVWEALLSIPLGCVRTYSEIAHSIEHPTAVRATATAIGRNPLSWLIPCHRVIRKTGELGGYHWGLPIKRAMLAWEAVRTESSNHSAHRAVHIE